MWTGSTTYTTSGTYTVSTTWTTTEPPDMGVVAWVVQPPDDGRGGATLPIGSDVGGSDERHGYDHHRA